MMRDAVSASEVSGSKYRLLFLKAQLQASKNKMLAYIAVPIYQNNDSFMLEFYIDGTLIIKNKNVSLKILGFMFDISNGLRITFA